MHSKKKVVVTGFGPFGPYTHNPSSDVVEHLEKFGIGTDHVDLVVQLMSVEYTEVEEIVNHLWDTHNPDLIIHIGVHPVSKTIKLEQQSFGLGYCRYDVQGGVPKNNTCPCVPSPVLKTKIDCDLVAKKVASSVSCPGLRIEKSEDPGRYLCGFSFYMSLCRDTSKALFVHVPEFDDDVTVDVVTDVVRKVIQEILSTQLEHNF